MQSSDSLGAETAAAIGGRQLLRNAVIGIAAGLSASWIMNRLQAVVGAATSDDGGSKVGGEEKPTTVKAADMLSETVTGEPVPERYDKPAGSAAHYGFGAFLGGLYGAWGAVMPSVRSGFGTAYGAGVALVADEALVPAAGLMPPPLRMPAQTHAYGIASHIIFGVALEGSRRVFQRAISPHRGSKDGGVQGWV